MDAKDIGFMFVAISEAIDANGEGNDSENADDDENCFHDLIIT